MGIQRKAVLVVDDNTDSRAALRALLEFGGHRVAEAATGAQAVAIAATDRPDVVLLDLTLPDMDGFEVVARIRAQPEGRRPFIVALTGHEGLEARTREAGCNAYIVKPGDPLRLAQIVAEAVAHSEALDV